MEELLSLLKDGRSRPVELLAAELRTSVEDIRRKIEFLERAGAIRRVGASSSGCAGGHNACPGCSGCTNGCTSGYTGVPKDSACSACMPEGGFKNMGVMWEVVE